MAVREALRSAAHNVGQHVAGFADTVAQRAPAVFAAARDAGSRVLREVAEVAPDVAQELQRNGWPDYLIAQAPNANGRVARAAMYVTAGAITVLAPPDASRRP